MIRIAYDFEFIETPPSRYGNSVTIDPVSIGAVDVDNPDRTYYAIFADFSGFDLALNPWLVDNVLPHLPFTLFSDTPMGGIALGGGHPDAQHVKDRAEIATELTAFILDGALNTTHIGHGVELWADWGAYDYVCLVTALGGWNARHPAIPMFSHDVQQQAARLGATGSLPEHTGRQHHALDDAAWCAQRVRHLDDLANGRLASGWNHA